MTRIAIAFAAAVIFTAPALAADGGGKSANPPGEQTAAAKAKPKEDKKETQEYLIVTMENVMVTSY